SSLILLLPISTLFPYTTLFRSSSNIWIWAIFVIPIILGMHTLYHWTHAEAVASDPVLQGKSPFLNIPFFIIRQIVYFTIWSFLRSEEHTSELQSRFDIVCRLLL